jgi:hypothetical protein
VTHQGCPPGVAAAPLAAWTHHTTSVPQPADTAATTPMTVATTTTTMITATTPWLCRRCARPQSGWVRQGFLRHGPRPVRAGWRHDHSP